MSQFRQIASKGTEGRRFAVLLLAGAVRTDVFVGWAFFIALFFLVGTEIGVQFLEDFVPGFVEIDVQVAQDLGSNAIAFAEEAEEDVLRADVAVVQRLGFLGCQSEDLFHPRGVGNVAHHFGLWAGTDLLLHLHADSFKVQPQFGQDVHGDALGQFDEAQQEVFRADVVVIETICLLACKGQDLLGAWGEIIHHFALCLSLRLGVVVVIV